MVQAVAQPSVRPSWTLVVDGMQCGGCMRKVETALVAVPGVVAARANLSAHRVDVVGGAKAPMTAEPLIAALHDIGFAARELAADDVRRPAAEHDLLRRLGAAGFASANIMLLSVAVWVGSGGEMDASLRTLMHWVSALIAMPAIAYAGVPFYASAVAALSHRRINMDVPISLGVLLATGMSLYQVMRGSEQVYFDAAVSLLFFLLIGRALDHRVRRQAAGAAENMLSLVGPATTVRLADGTTQRIATRSVVPGMTVLVTSGERVPVDARLEHGSAMLDESLITGETVPRHARPGELLYAGTINLANPLEAVATACDQNTLLAEITRLMRTAEQARSRYVRLADRAARLYAPAVHLLGLTTFIAWMWLGAGWEDALTAAIAVLIITCPCALALAVPAVQVAAVSRLFRHGIIVKSPDALERLAEVDTVVLDKTGTLTVGELRLDDTLAVEPGVLEQAAALAAASRHPYSRAVVAAARERGIAVAPLRDVVEIAGAGLEAKADGQVVRLGSAAFCGAAPGEDEGPMLWFRAGTSTPVSFRFTDPLRSDARMVVDRLGRLGYVVELLSGDRIATVRAMATEAGIGTWAGGLAPQAKTQRIEDLSATGHKVLMIGDGLNDAPALAAGHASLAPSTATDISQNAADAIFQGSRLAPVLATLAVARAARRAALVNFLIAIGYNVVFVPLAMTGHVTPLVAAIAMSLSSVTVTAHAAWLGYRRLEDVP